MNLRWCSRGGATRSKKPYEDKTTRIFIARRAVIAHTGHKSAHKSRFRCRGLWFDAEKKTKKTTQTRRNILHVERFYEDRRKKEKNIIAIF
jgi:hypothetical protein